jgi:hypothetical protein
LGGSKK